MYMCLLFASYGLNKSGGFNLLILQSGKVPKRTC